jgi:3-deoxy-D-manno-octulosonic-acid transferase
LLTLILASPWLLWRSLRTGRYREGWREKLFGNVPVRQGDAPHIWLHAVSVGEVNLLRTVVSELQSQSPGTEIVISTTTQTGMDLARRLFPGLRLFYAPLDFSWSVRRALARIRPQVLALAELEVWPNWIRLAQSSGVKIAVLNGRLGEKSFRGYQRFGWLTRGTFASIDLVAAQNEIYADRFARCGVLEDNIHVTGSIKFDGANTDRQHPEVARLAELASIQPSETVFLAGSTQSPEEAFAIDAWQACREKHSGLRLILVPRHPERFQEVALLLKQRGIRFDRRSTLNTNFGQDPAPVLLVDQVGELRWWWGSAQIAYVGGSLTNRGGQNMIEPAAVGAAISFGPNTWNFKDVVESLLGASAAVVVRNGEELTTFVMKCLDEPAWKAELGKSAVHVAIMGQGATKRTVEMLAPWLNSQRTLKKAA